MIQISLLQLFITLLILTLPVSCEKDDNVSFKADGTQFYGKTVSYDTKKGNCFYIRGGIWKRSPELDRAMVQFPVSMGNEEISFDIEVDSKKEKRKNFEFSFGVLYTTPEDFFKKKELFGWWVKGKCTAAIQPLSFDVKIARKSDNHIIFNEHYKNNKCPECPDTFYGQVLDCNTPPCDGSHIWKIISRAKLESGRYNINIKNNIRFIQKYQTFLLIKMKDSCKEYTNPLKDSTI